MPWRLHTTHSPSSTKDHEARRPLTQRARTSSTNLADLSNVAYRVVCSPCHLAAASCRLHAAHCDEIRHNRWPNRHCNNPVQSATAHGEMVAHHCHYSNSQAHHAQALAPRGKRSTAATRELHVTELSILMLISMFDNVTSSFARLGTKLLIVFLLCRRPKTLRASDPPSALDPSHDLRSPENDETAPQLVK